MDRKNFSVIDNFKLAHTIKIKGYKKENKKYLAFTLAEVLITLVVIGIVAAMTIPTLIGKYKDQATVTKLKKAQSVLSQALTMYNALNGPLFTIGDYGYVVWADDSKGAEISEDILKSLKIVKYDSDADSSPSNDNFSANTLWMMSMTVAAMTEDGIIYGMHAIYPGFGFFVCTDYDNNTYHCKNRFTFMPTENATLIPQGAPGTSYEIKKSDVCPNDDATPWDNPCAYWTLMTGKVKKNAGEWDDSLGEEPSGT